MKKALPVLSIAFLFFASPLEAWAQFVVGYDPQGVDLDANGTMRLRKVDMDARLADLRKKAAGKVKEGDLCYVSLPQAFADARKCIEAGKPLPDSLRYLNGMVQLKYIFVFPEEKDLVIAGPAEPFDAKSSFRPLGAVTGRPVLQLDDLVTALRACGPGKTPDRIGCDIEVTKEIVERASAKLKELTPQLSAGKINARQMADAIAEAGGLQPVTWFGVDPDTRFAFVCVEADYLLKQLALGLLKSPVSGVKSYNDLVRQPEQAHRFSLETKYEAILVSPEGDSFELKGPSLKVNTGLLALLNPGGGEPSAAAKEFAESCNKHFAELARAILSWSDLCNLSDLTVLARLVGKDELDTKVGWDLSWIVDPKGYPVAKGPVPKSARLLCNYHSAGNMIIFSRGGVWLAASTWVDKREADTEGKLQPWRRRPPGTDVPTGPK